MISGPNPKLVWRNLGSFPKISEVDLLVLHHFIKPNQDE